LVPKRNEESRDMLAVSIDLPESRARALGREARRGDQELDSVRLGLGPADLPSRGELLHLDVVDRAAADVVITAEKRSRAEEAAQGAVVELAQRFRERGRHSRRVTPKMRAFLC
jgi:hypothetical protein